MIRRLLTILSVLSVLASPVAAEIAPSGAPYDGGGNIWLRAKHIWDLNHGSELDGPPFVIPTRCMSACTMYLGLENACARPRGTFHFHSASTPLPGFSPPVRLANLRMASYYPKRLRAWFYSDEGPGSTLSTRFIVVPAAELIARGEVRSCKGL